MWTIDELVERVREALAAEYPGAPNARVRSLPDRRAIRWYTTIGLVDKPLGMRGRTALYGPRHLQQLVAIKRRQAQGQSLAQIQADFVWITPEALREAAQVPEHLLNEVDGIPPDPVGEARTRFWADPAAPAPQPPAIVAAATDRAPRPVTAYPVNGVALGGGVTLLVPHALTDRDRDDIAAVATPLIELLAARGLIDGSSA
ncbi:MerR family transcriptional regulator [Paractinoplanes atraurantiacus]|uniref:MerR HTH family regulatory protein n=1 Tax=Paractinoplanes atraurantiacus TaxID=1036182 RepID=A0A285IM54_9ACTN|nr:MerR family transcriptional regulator [Actinoplanes atraurantiacus]SNY49100.1 MerR HTH family regulatory protein [Actinoplanes atraurantiacus]